MVKRVIKSKQVRIMDMDRDQLIKLIERREKSLRFAKGLLASMVLATDLSKEG